jgi:sporulation protein YlmC with PRC-barrel domain
VETIVSDVKLELLLGRRVVDVEGVTVGRIEEVLADVEGDELLVTEYHVGRYGLFERLSIFHIGSGLLRYLGGRAQSAKPYRVPWDKLDLSEPEHPRLTCTMKELG